MRWARPKCDREQMVLFATRLDDALQQDHMVRVVDQVMDRIDWRPMENLYHQTLGQPPIHPRILSAVILYGLICRIRACRKLEEALHIRIDFRWLAHGMAIDHTTLSEFRRKHPEQLRDLFVQLVMIGKEMGLVTFERIAFDGTRVRAANRQTGSRTPARLRELKAKLQEEFDRLSEKADAEDAEDEEVFASNTNNKTADQSAADATSQASDQANNKDNNTPDPQQRLKQIEQAKEKVNAALAELDKIDNAPEKAPARIPITDPESRITKCKEGGFAPNYTPTATVDCDSGMIVDQTVIPQSNESDQLVPTIEQVQQDFGLDKPVPEVLADGLMATGENIEACEDRGVNLFSPVPGAHEGHNPAVRDDLAKPVPADAIKSLPMRNVTIDGSKQQRFDKQAFVYVDADDVYRCPQGEALTKSSSYRTTDAGKLVRRTRYRAPETSCSSCPLASQCLSGKAKFRQIDRGEHESAIDRQKAKMRESDSQSIYGSRRSVGERPFAVIKHVFGLRQFLTRGLSRVRQEWSWATLAFNVLQLMRHLERGSSP